jgi:hypothetical protein|tara:strand:- start:14472 stop:16403 length:1932 start_codon:yes stop_codon:yes gene_type:complete
MELLRDPKVEQQFQKLVANFLAKNKNYDITKFIGGLPVTLERSDMAHLMTKGRDDKSKYTVTQKVDGTRVLMYIGPDSETASVKQRTVCFVDRNMKIYTVRNDTRDILPYVNTPEMLLDGEIVFFDQDGTAHKELESRYVKGVSFMTFDILFGPENIDINSENEKIIGQEFSFIVPEDGKLKTFPWQYINRYDILHKLIIPSKFNKSEPILTGAFKSVNWFNIELKPIYFLESLKTHRVLYNESKTGYLQTLLSGNRRDFYNFLMKTYGKQINIFIKKTLKLDGLIFTAADTLYTIGSWDKLLTTQYKWKPSNEQTVDLLVRKVSPQAAGLFVSKSGNIEPYQVNYKQVIVQVPQNIKDNDVAEFSIDESGRFIFKELRKDKKTPNALRTVLNVINSFKNPVIINDLYYFLNLSESSSKAEIKKVLEYSTKTKLLRCVANYKTINLLESKQLNLINDMIKNVNVNKEIEVELRFGILKQGFNPKISKQSFIDILRKVESFDFQKTVDDFVDVYSENIRTRYIFSNEFGKYIFFDSIIKNRISKIDITMQNVINYDVRIAMSSEVKVKQYNTVGDSYRKYRLSFTEPNGLFRIDFTAITSGEYSDRSFVMNKDSNETFQIEIEFLKNDININNLFKFITQMLAS